MKNSALTFITLFISFFIFSQEKQAEIKFEVTTIDYGEVEYDTKRVGIFMKSISVVSNSKNSSIVLRIKGEVLEEEDEEEDEEKNNI